MLEPIRIRIDGTIFDRFPAMAVHGFRASGTGLAAGRIDAGRLLADACKEVLQRGYDLSKAAEVPLVRSWREAYSTAGLQPSKYRSSIESLLRRALKDGSSLTTSIPTVDIYNSCSLMHSAPLGAYDSTLLPTSEIMLRIADPNVDSFLPLGGEPKDFPLKSSLLIYASGHNVICYGFNCRDSRLTALRTETQEAVFCSESTTTAQRQASEHALTHLKSLLTDAGARTTAVESIDRGRPEAELVDLQ
jgi:DNA/RNA-binding domain of Phe-tRNA-synthetase-like protein